MASARQSSNSWMQWLPVVVPYAWLVIFFLVPFLIVLKISLSTPELAMPPYSPVFDVASDTWSMTKEKIAAFTSENYFRLFEDDIYWRSYVSSLWIALTATLMTLVVAYPIAYGMARAPQEWRPMLLMLVILPFWTSFLIRVYAWMGLLSHSGFLNTFLLWAGLIDKPLVILNTNTAVYIGIVYTYLPFMVLPLYAALERMDDSLLEAAADLGSSPLRSFWQITFPLSLPGVIAGCFLVFIPVVGEFIIPDLLGGSDTLMIGKVMWEEFFNARDWPAAAAVAIVLLLILVVPIALYQNQQARASGAHL